MYPASHGQEVGIVFASVGHHVAPTFHSQWTDTVCAAA